MNYRTLGRTDLSVSALALGTVELGLDYGIATPDHAGRPSEMDAIKLVHAALDQGINFIDTARAYGESEAVLGKALAGRRGEVIIATKGTVPTGDDGSPEQVRATIFESLHTSLDLLQTEYVDIWMIHNSDQTVLAQHELLHEIFAEVKASGKVRWFGGTFYGVADPLAALATDLFDVYQITYSVLDQRVADQFLIDAQTKNVGVVARSVLLQGVLTERGDHLPDRLDALRERSRQFRQLIDEAGLDMSAPQAALAFALAQQKIQSVLVGVSTEAELAENLQAGKHTLPADLLDALNQLRLDDEDLLNPGTWKLE